MSIDLVEENVEAGKDGYSGTVKVTLTSDAGETPVVFRVPFSNAPDGWAARSRAINAVLDEIRAWHAEASAALDKEAPPTFQGKL